MCYDGCAERRARISSLSEGATARPRVEITYRFGPPEPRLGRAAGEESALGIRDSEEFAKAHGRGGSEGLLRGHPKMNSYEVTVERGPEARGSD
jgi:hypothetical protein